MHGLAAVAAPGRRIRPVRTLHLYRQTANTAPDEPRDSWREDAACLDHPAEWFTGPHEPGDTRRAIDVCTTCPVKQPCLEAALQIEVSADLGVWGGTTPAARRRLRGRQTDTDTAPSTRRRSVAKQERAEVAQTPSNALILFEDEHGDHVDGTGRVIVFEVHGEPPYMVMVDGKPRARTFDVDDAAALAGRLLAAEARRELVEHHSSVGLPADQPACDIARGRSRAGR